MDFVVLVMILLVIQGKRDLKVAEKKSLEEDHHGSNKKHVLVEVVRNNSLAKHHHGNKRKNYIVEVDKKMSVLEGHLGNKRKMGRGGRKMDYNEEEDLNVEIAIGLNSHVMEVMEVMKVMKHCRRWLRMQRKPEPRKPEGRVCVPFQHRMWTLVNLSLFNSL